MKIYNDTKLDTATLRTLVHHAHAHVLRVDGKVPTWGPQFVQIQEAAERSTSASPDTVTVTTDVSESAERLLDRLIWGFRWWGAVKSDKRDEYKASDRLTEQLTLLSILESAGVRAGTLPRKPRPPEPSAIEKIGNEEKKLDMRELQWQRRIRRAETALKTIARERKVLQRRAAALLLKKAKEEL